MKKITKQLISFGLIVSIMLSYTLSVEAYDNIGVEIPNQILNYAKSMGLRNLTRVRKLYSPDDILIGYCAEGFNEYIIYDVEYNVIEYSDCNTSRYAGMNSKAYYAGPLSYYVKENSGYVDLSSSEVLTRDDFRSGTQIISDIRINNFSDNTELLSTNSSDLNIVTKTIDGELDNLDWNPDGCCGQLAATMILPYLEVSFGIGLSSFFVQNPYYLLQDLKSIIPHGSEDYGTTYSQLSGGLNTYASKKKCSIYSYYSKNKASYYNTYKSCIIADQPSIVGLDEYRVNSNLYYEAHWVAGYGYRLVYYQGSLAQSQFIVNDGKGNSGIYIINNEHVDGVVYIMPK